MVYDSKDGYLVLFGGSDGASDTWKYEAGNWTLLHPSQSPSSRTYFCMTYDNASDSVFLFGGKSRTQVLENDTWEFQGGKWTNLSLTDHPGAPPALADPACAYDPSLGGVVLFGGQTSATRGTNFTWLFEDSLESWTNLTPLLRNSPSARFDPALAYDGKNAMLVLFGGAEGAPPVCYCFDDTWTLTGTPSHPAWSNATSASPGTGHPPGRLFTSLAYDTADQYVVSFGGQANRYKSLNSSQNATWTLAGFVDGTANWENTTPSLSPGTRFGAAMAYDDETRHVVLFSGLSATISGAPLQDDFWEYAAGVWRPLSFPVVFGETGLPNGANWSVTMNGSAVSGTVSSANRTVFQDRPNGTFEYTIRAPSGYDALPAAGTVTMSGQLVTVGITFVPVYPISFKESGLASKTRWSVSLKPSSGAATVLNSTTGSITFHAGNGSYTYTLTPIPGYYARNYSGTLNVSGRSVSVPVAFFKTTYTVTFSESELPHGSSWNVTLNGKTTTSTGAQITVALANGTYRYTVASAGYTAHPSSGSIPVDGSAPPAIDVTFTSASDRPATGPGSQPEAGPRAPGIPRGSSWASFPSVGRAEPENVSVGIR